MAYERPAGQRDFTRDREPRERRDRRDRRDRAPRQRSEARPAAPAAPVDPQVEAENARIQEQARRENSSGATSSTREWL